jgi:hypothetical protein
MPILPTVDEVVFPCSAIGQYQSFLGSRERSDVERLDCRVLVAAPECFFRAFPLNTLHVRLLCSGAARVTPTSRIDVAEHQSLEVLIHHCRYEFSDEFANAHAPKRCLQC